MTTVNIIKRECVEPYSAVSDILLYLDDVVSQESPPSLNDIYLRLAADLMAVQDEMIETDEDSDDAECDPDEDSDEDDNGCNFTTIRDETEAARQWREQLEADTRAAEEVRK